MIRLPGEGELVPVAGDETVRALCLYTPAGYENYFRDVHAAVSAGAPVTDELLTEFRARYNTTPY